MFSAFKPGEDFTAWMSHGDKVLELGEGMEVAAKTDSCPIAGFVAPTKKLFGVQFHPEVHHTPRGKDLFSKFLFECAGLETDWDASGFIEETVARIAAEVPEGNVVCGLSGGVDSTVAAKLVHEAIGDRLYCIFVDNGLLRADEAEEVMEDMQSLGLQVKKVAVSYTHLTLPTNREV